MVEKAFFYRMRVLLILVTCLFSSNTEVYGQEKQRSLKSIQGSRFTTVFIKLNTYAELEIITTDEDEVQIDEMRDGEYYDARILNTRISNDSLYITDVGNALYDRKDDKLAAHKVMDARVKICLPRGKRLRIETEDAVLSISGVYNAMNVNQNSGTVTFSNLKGNLVYRSISANVEWYARQYFLRALDRTGRIEEVTSRPISSTAVVETIKGRVKMVDK